MSYKSKFSEVKVGSICLFGTVRIKKTSDIPTKGKLLSKCASNCVSLHNGHKCVVSDRAVVEVVD